MSFGESVFPAGFNQKTAKEDLFVKVNYGILPRKQRGKILEDSRRLSTKADPEGYHVGSAGPPVSLHITMLVLHHLLGCIHTVL